MILWYVSDRWRDEQTCQVRFCHVGRALSLSHEKGQNVDWQGPYEGHNTGTSFSITLLLKLEKMLSLRTQRGRARGVDKIRISFKRPQSWQLLKTGFYVFRTCLLNSSSRITQSLARTFSRARWTRLRVPDTGRERELCDKQKSTPKVNSKLKTSTNKRPCILLISSSLENPPKGTLYQRTKCSSPNFKFRPEAKLPT